MQQLLNKKFLLPLLVVLAGLYIYSLPGRVPDVDDAWIGEHAYWLATEGHVKSVLMSGITQQEDRLVVHHKLLTLHGALFIRLFGFSVYTLKAVSLLYFLVFLGLFYLYTVRIRKIFDVNQWLLSMTLIFSFPYIFQYSFMFRPEIMVMTLAFLSFVLLENAILNARYPFLDIFIAGIVSGLAFATHLNAGVVMGAGGLLLLVNRRFYGLLVYGGAAVLSSLVYWYDIAAPYGFDFWLFQLSESPALDIEPGLPALMKPLVNLLNEHMRFFHNPKIIIFTVFMVTVIGAGFRSLLKKNRDITFYAVFLALLTALFAVRKSRHYMLVYYPYLVILITLTLHRMISGEFRRASAQWFRTFVIVLFSIFVAGSTLYNIRLSEEKFSPSQNRSISMKYIHGDHSELKIIAPMTFIFNEIEYYGAIVSELSYTERQKTEEHLFGSGFLKTARQEGIDRIILTPYYRKALGMDALPEKRSGYRVIHEDDDLLILSSGEPDDEP